MIETVKWKEVYALWDYGVCGFSELLTAPIAVKKRMAYSAIHLIKRRQFSRIQLS